MWGGSRGKRRDRQADTNKRPTMPVYLSPKQDNVNKIPELQVYLAEALYDVSEIVS